MSAIIDFLKQDDNTLYPVTLTCSVYDLDGNVLDDILDSYLPLAGGTMVGPVYFDSSSENTSTEKFETVIGYGATFTDVADTTPLSIYKKKIDASTNKGITKTYVEMTDDTLSFGRTDYDANGDPMLPQDGDNIYFQYYDYDKNKYRNAMSIDGIRGNIDIFKKIKSTDSITASKFISTTPIEITIGAATKTWDGCSPLVFTLEEIQGSV